MKKCGNGSPYGGRKNFSKTSKTIHIFLRYSVERGKNMFGFVTANLQELTKEQRLRYQAVYCGICRQLRRQASRLSRFALSYDMTFLALLLMSLYEPEEQAGPHACAIHLSRPWVDNDYIRYAADMNLALAYHKARDDEQDEASPKGKFLGGVLGKHYPRIAQNIPGSAVPWSAASPN